MRSIMGGVADLAPGALTGRLLVASPLLDEETFRRSVVLVLDHDGDGALGVILNRPSRMPVAEVLPDWHDVTTEPCVLYRGGPVGPDSAVAVARMRSGPVAGLRPVHGSFAVVDLDGSPEQTAAATTGLRVYAGYAGWSTGQLEDEIVGGSWFVVEADPADPFTDHPDRLWRSVLRRQGGELAFLHTYPDDPHDN